jgi:hypothetical protein
MVDEDTEEDEANAEWEADKKKEELQPTLVDNDTMNERLSENPDDW